MVSLVMAAVARNAYRPLLFGKVSPPKEKVQVCSRDRKK